MKKKEIISSTVAITTVLLMSAVTTACSGRNVPTSTPTPNIIEKQVDLSTYADIDNEASEAVLHYNEEVEVNVGSALTVEQLGIELDGSTDLTYEFNKNAYKSLGEYTENVKVIKKSTNKVFDLTVKVKVVDKVKPVLKGVKNVTMIQGKKVNLKRGVSATDNVDGNISKKIKVSKYNPKLINKAQNITYSVTDSSGNTTKKTVKLTIKSDPVQKLDKYMYATSSVNVRNTSSSKGKKVGSLTYGQKVHVTGRDKNTGWYRISFNGKIGWVSDSYLSGSKPKTQTPTYKKPSKPSNSNNNNSKKPSTPTKNCNSNCKTSLIFCRDCNCNNCERDGDCFDLN